MSFWPGEKLRYAETHFKFKLPWSLLYRPWPEIIFDMPFQTVPGLTSTLWIVVRDADRFPVLLESATMEINSKFGNETRNIRLGKECREPLAFYPVPVPNLEPGTYKIFPSLTARRLAATTEPAASCKRCEKSSANGVNQTAQPIGNAQSIGNALENARGTALENAQPIGTARTFSRWNLPGLTPAPIILKVLAENVPKAPGYAAGEMHCHTHYSRDHVEFGATPDVLQQAAKAVGLDFVSCTDHAYDFAFTDEDYTREAQSPAPRFQSLRDSIASLPHDFENPLMLAGEEVSVGNSKGENVHTTVLAPEAYIPGLGDCGRYWLENKPTLRIPQMLKSTQAHCFAAHPFQQMGLLEKFIFRRGYWKHEDLNIGAGHEIRGIQFWNGVRDEGFRLGREFWINELGKGNFLLPVGGNDAHGDLNDTTAVSLPLFSLKHSRDHVFGNVRTVVKLPEKAVEEISPITTEILHKAFEGDNCYITDGPALWWERSSTQLTIHARNTHDFGGAYRYIRIFGRRYLHNGKFAPAEELCIESLIAPPANTDITVNIDNFAYLRAECETASGKFAMTSAAAFPRG